LFASLIAISKEIEARTPGIADDIDEIADKAKVDLDQVKKFVSDGNAEAVENILANLEQASKDATTVSADVKPASAKIKELADEAKEILAENRGNVGSSVENLEYILRSVAQNIDSLTHNLDGTARNLNEFSRLIRQQPGLLLSGGTPEADKGLTPSSEPGQGSQ
jgi:phospholipid/cholesterol/gamma-HCH transport system substrate-binding protein